MKYKFFLATIFCFLFILIGQVNANIKNLRNEKLVELKRFNKIDRTYHSTNGYTIRIVGDLNHNWTFTSWSFKGKVYITGNGVNIVLTLELTEPRPTPDIVDAKFDEYASVDISGNGTAATSVIWTTGNQTAYDVLNSQEIVDAFLADVNFETFN
ncbi:MAG: hypothetical protein K2X37_07485 [Chitinophagaceae bacterium]|nr:hypothetical protein [Chitinophagaceae bacterium]